MAGEVSATDPLPLTYILYLTRAKWDYAATRFSCTERMRSNNGPERWVTPPSGQLITLKHVWQCNGFWAHLLFNIIKNTVQIFFSFFFFLINKAYSFYKSRNIHKQSCQDCSPDACSVKSAVSTICSADSTTQKTIKQVTVKPVSGVLTDLINRVKQHSRERLITKKYHIP